VDIEVYQFTRKEAEAAVERFFAVGVQVRHLILEMHERKADKALGYSTFEEFTRDRLGADWNDGYLRQLRMWASVERQVLVDVEKQRLTKRMVDELLRLPDEKRKQAFEEASMLHADNPLRDLKHIVNRMLGTSDKYGKARETTASPEPEVPVGAIVDVHTGRPVVEVHSTPTPAREDAKPIIADFGKGNHTFEIKKEANQAPIIEAIPEEPRDPFADEAEGDEVLHDEELYYLSDETQKKLAQFRKFWNMTSDLETVEKIINQLYTTYSNKPNFAKLAEQTHDANS